MGWCKLTSLWKYSLSHLIRAQQVSWQGLEPNNNNIFIVFVQSWIHYSVFFSPFYMNFRLYSFSSYLITYSTFYSDQKSPLLRVSMDFLIWLPFKMSEEDTKINICYHISKFPTHDGVLWLHVFCFVLFSGTPWSLICRRHYLKTRNE